MQTDPLIGAAKRILVADDHPLYREALKDSVIPAACPGAELVEAASEKEVLSAITSDSCFDLVLLDLNLPGAVGMSCLLEIRKLAALTPVAIVSANEEPSIMGEAIIAGATGFIPKSGSRQQLIDAIRTIMAGGTYVTNSAIVALRRMQTPTEGAPQASTANQLTSRQWFVLELLAKGLSNKQIARELGISEITTKAHVSAILKKFGLSNRVQAAIEARRLMALRR